MRKTYRHSYNSVVPMHTLPMEDIMLLIRQQIDVGHSVRFSPRGVSMLPMLREGRDSVILSSLPERLQRYDLVLYKRNNGEYVLHRIVVAGETYTCSGDNQSILEHGLRYEQMIAKVTAFYRDEKLYNINDFRYRLYCRLWCFNLNIRRFLKRAFNWMRIRLKSVTEKL